MNSGGAHLPLPLTSLATLVIRDGIPIAPLRPGVKEGQVGAGCVAHVERSSAFLGCVNATTGDRHLEPNRDWICWRHSAS